MDKMCDYFGKGHEFFLALKKAGFDDEKIQRVINSKGNVLAMAMFEAYLKAAEQNVFELIYELVMPIAEITESKFLQMCQLQFRNEGWNFDRNLLKIYGQPSSLKGWYRAKIYHLKEAMPREKVRQFIAANGSFPGVFGTASFWMFEAIREKTQSSESTGDKNKASFPQGLRVFGLEEKSIKKNPCLIRFEGEKPNWFFDLSAVASADDRVPANEAFLVLEKISEENVPHFSEIELQ